MISDLKTCDYEHIILDLCKQAKEIIPDDLKENDKKYILEIIYNFMNVALDGLKEDDDINYSQNEVILVVQFIGEWIFHKGIDLSRANMEKEHKDKVLLQIAFVIYEIVKQALERKLSKEQIVKVAEHHVNKKYREKLEELCKNNVINKKVYENALS